MVKTGAKYMEKGKEVSEIVFFNAIEDTSICEGRCDASCSCDDDCDYHCDYCSCDDTCDSCGCEDSRTSGY